MRVQHNIMAMNSYRNYNNNSSSINKNIEKLSSGYQINRAGDNAAGLAISEKMRAQITGLEVAQKNAKDGISLVQTAEGALTEVHSMLNRMYELAEQSANGTFNDKVDRAQLQKEVESLKTEIDRIADSANFNGTNLLDGTLSAGGTAGTAGLSGGTGGTGSSSSGVTITDSTNVASVDMQSSTATGAINFGVASQQGGNGAIITVKVGTATYTKAVTATDASKEYELENTADASDKIKVKLQDAAQTSLGNAIGAFDATKDIAADDVGTVAASSGGTGGTGTGGAGLSAGGSGGPLTLQIGDDSNTWNQMKVSIDDIHVGKLGTYSTTAATGTTPAYKTTTASSNDPSAPTTIKDIDISSQTNATASLNVIKDAINYVSDTRGGLGAIQNRLEHTINNLSVMQENMQDAESTIRDTDVAAEMMKYTKNSILVQSAQAMLAQANQQPQGVLQLLQ